MVITFIMNLQSPMLELTRQLNQRYKKEEIPYYPSDWLGQPSKEDEEFPPKSSFNLISALHHVSGTMAFTFECSHGCLPDGSLEPMVSYADILDIQLILYEEMLDYLLANRQYWN